MQLSHYCDSDCTKIKPPCLRSHKPEFPPPNYAGMTDDMLFISDMTSNFPRILLLVGLFLSIRFSDLHITHSY